MATLLQNDSRPLPHDVAVETVALTTALLFANGQTTERMVVATQGLSAILGLPVRVIPNWDQIAIEIEQAPYVVLIPIRPLGVDMRKVQAITTLMNQVSEDAIRDSDIEPALRNIQSLPEASAFRVALFSGLAAAALGVIFGANDATSLGLIVASAAAGGGTRRRLACLAGNPFIQPLCAAAIAGVTAALAGSWRVSDQLSLIALCPCMVLAPGPHILNGAIDLAHARVSLGVARLTYAGVIILMTCSGLLTGLAIGGAALPTTVPSAQVPLMVDAVAAGCAVAAFGALLSVPMWLLPVPIAVGVLAHATRWALISRFGMDIAASTFVACSLTGLIAALLVDRLGLSFAAVGFSAIISMTPGFFLFRAAGEAVKFVSLGERGSADLLVGVFANGVTAFAVILAMTFGLIWPRMVFSRFASPLARLTPRRQLARDRLNFVFNVVEARAKAPRL